VIKLILLLSSSSLSLSLSSLSLSLLHIPVNEEVIVFSTQIVQKTVYVKDTITSVYDDALKKQTNETFFM